jgi:predicted ATPase
MELTKVRIRNFRSINDSGDITVGKITALVGRNESGKSAMLLALAALNPAGGRQPFSQIKDFPRGRRLEECKLDTPVVETRWKLSPDETAQIAKTLNYGAPIIEVSIGHGYSPDPQVKLEGIQEPTLNGEDVNAIVSHLRTDLTQRIAALEAPDRANCEAAWQRLEESGSLTSDKKAWAAAVAPALADLRMRLGEAAVTLDDAQSASLLQIETHANLIGGFDQAHANARALPLSWLPIFVYVSDLPELNGHQNLDSFTQQRGQDPSIKEREDNFAKLAKIAEFDPVYLNTHRDDYETRAQILNRAGALVTGEIRRLWKDRTLMIRFNLDGPHLAVLVSDSNAKYPVEVNLDERSRGFRWFFAFYITFSADTQGGNADGAILLLDEPGLHLHAKSQEDLLGHLRHDYKNQIIYTTHSPFMVPPDAINIVRTVNIDPEQGTTVTDSPSEASPQTDESCIVPFT